MTLQCPEKKPPPFQDQHNDTEDLGHRKQYLLRSNQLSQSAHRDGFHKLSFHTRWRTNQNRHHFTKKTSTFLKVVTIGFACLEILGVVILQFANQCEWWESYPNTLSVCNFGGWQLAEKEEISLVHRQLTFFALYWKQQTHDGVIIHCVCLLNQ